MAEKTADELAAEKAAADTAEAEKNKDKVKFDAAQTLFVNNLYNRAHGEAKEKADKEWAEKLAAEKAELARIAAEEKAALLAQLDELKKVQTPKPDEKPPEAKIEDNPLFKQMQAQYQEIHGIFSAVKQERDALKANQDKTEKERIKSRKKDQFLGALGDAKVNFFDPLEAYELAEREGLEYDAARDSVFVKNPATGLPKLNGNGEPMNAVDFVKDFASRKKYLVKAATQEGGIGSTSSSELPAKSKTEDKDWTKASKEEFDAEVQRLLSLPR